jgi:hypothetical protein
VCFHPTGPTSTTSMPAEHSISIPYPVSKSNDVPRHEEQSAGHSDISSSGRNVLLHEFGDPVGSILDAGTKAYDLSRTHTWGDAGAAMPDAYASDSSNNLTDRDKEGRIKLRHVRVKLIDLEWGGEYIKNPCQYVYGYVLEMVFEENAANPCFVVDFGNYLGI